MLTDNTDIKRDEMLNGFGQTAAEFKRFLPGDFGFIIRDASMSVNYKTKIDTNKEIKKSKKQRRRIIKKIEKEDLTRAIIL